MSHATGTGTTMSPEMQHCIDLCHECTNACQQTMAYCLQQGGQHAAAEHVLLLLDCTEIREACATMMSHGSAFSGRVCGVCAEVCDRCARSCAQFSGDAQMQACADVCRRCAASCRNMAA